MISPYGRALVVLHWVLAVLIVLALAGGALTGLVPNADATKLDLLRYHMAGGMFVFLLMSVRFGLRWRSMRRGGHDAVPAHEKVVHLAFYAAVLAMAVTGMVTALQANLNEIVFAGSGDPLPATLTIYSSRLVHRYVALSIVGLLVLHVGAAIANHRRGRDPLARMSLRSTSRVSEKD